MGLPKRRKRARESEGESQADALKGAIKFLSYRGRSVAEVQTKLFQLGFQPKVVQITLEKLRSLKLLNDEAFARDWAVSRAEGRGYGPVRIKRELQQKGIAKSVIGGVVEEVFGSRDVKERARKLLEKRFGAEGLRDAKVLGRAVGFLRRRGYHDSMIAELVGKSFGDD